MMAVCPSATKTNMVRDAMKLLSPEDQELTIKKLGVLKPENIAAAAGNLILHGRPGEVVSVNAGNTVYCYPDTQLAVYQACQLCHSVLSILGLASPGEMVSVNKLKVAFIFICLLMQLCVLFFFSFIIN